MTAAHFSALADPTRQRIVEMLATGALSSGEIAGRFSLSPPAISQHLKALKQARLVTVRADKQKRIYTLDPEGVAEVSAWVDRIKAFWNPDAPQTGRRSDLGAARQLDIGDAAIGLQFGQDAQVNGVQLAGVHGVPAVGVCL